jgi:hypothetical protein
MARISNRKVDQVAKRYGAPGPRTAGKLGRALPNPFTLAFRGQRFAYEIAREAPDDDVLA